MIVTEGKTDSKYIKAALKKLYKRYPELIEKINGNFIFKIDFLKHSNTAEYLFYVPEGEKASNIGIIIFRVKYLVIFLNKNFL